MRQSFTAWLLRQTDRADPIGDLASDVTRDPDWPARSKSLNRLLAYLVGRGACDGAIAALRAAWEEWQEVAREPVLS